MCAQLTRILPVRLAITAISAQSCLRAHGMNFAVSDYRELAAFLQGHARDDAASEQQHYKPRPVPEFELS